MYEDDCELFVSCLAGMEQLLGDELRSLGASRVRPLSGGVSCHADQKTAYRICLWSRLGSRVTLVLGRVDAADADALYRGVKSLHWEELIAEGASMAVRAHGTNEQLRNTRFSAMKVKDAVCDRLRVMRGSRPDVDAEDPDALIDLRIREERATVSLDLSGASLYKRSYLAAEDGDEAALSCAQSSGLLALAGWKRKAGEGWALVDPSCGDGVLVVEAAALACDLAPNLVRDRWGFFGWARHDEEVWEELLDEADERFERGLSALVSDEAASAPSSTRPDLASVRFVGACTSSPSIARARERAKRAGLRQAVSFEYGAAEDMPALVERVAAAAAKDTPSTFAARADDDLVGAAGLAPAGVVPVDAAKPPCLVAMIQSARDRASEAQGQASSSAFIAAAKAAPEASAFAAIGAADLEARFGIAPAGKLTFGRERMAADALFFDEPPAQTTPILVPDSAGGAEHRVEVLDPNSAQFAARLHKCYKERRKWAKREGVSCYRVYDADLPEYAVAIDLYEGAGEAAGNTYLHIAEYAAPSDIDPVRARRRFNDVLSVAPVVMGVRPDHVFSKTRMRDKGGGQYRDEERRAYVTQVEEDGFLFEVDLSSYLDTGLFLDHRPTRERIEELAAGKRFLNLFAYTGAATVHAAGGGAADTCTVDLSQTYLDWARRNMELNGFTGPEHSFERADAMSWITECRRSPRRFDLIFVDPPTFSNSKAMGSRSFDVQRDHVELLIGVSRLLAKDGLAIFSCNLRSFKPDVEELERYGVSIENITPETIPHDFERNPRIHSCFLVRHVG